jgi:hypothetical protein
LPHTSNLKPVGSFLIGIVLSLLPLAGVDAMEQPKHIVLLGASVGKAWNIDGLPQRVGLQGYRFEYVGKYDFDKTSALREILSRSETKPHAVFLKECAAYFPGDLSKYQDLVKGWVMECRRAGVVPIPTTVVPVIRDRSLVTQAKDLVKRLIGRPTSTARLAGILEYNDWVRSSALAQGLGVLDLETPLRVSETDRSLRLDLHSGDGLHLNAKAYAILDAIVLAALEKCFSNAKGPVTRAPE